MLSSIEKLPSFNTLMVILAVIALGAFICTIFFYLRRYHTNTQRRITQRVGQLQVFLGELSKVQSLAMCKLQEAQAGLDSRLLDIENRLQKSNIQLEAALLAKIDIVHRSNQSIETQVTKLQNNHLVWDTQLSELRAVTNKLDQQVKKVDRDIATHQNSLSDMAVSFNEKTQSIIRTVDSLSHDQRYQSRKLSRLYLANAIDAELEEGEKADSNPDLAGFADLIQDKAEPLTVLVTGMRHSGSTALFNVLRYLFESIGVQYESGYSQIDHFRDLQLRSDRVRLIKAHEFRDDLVDSADVILTTRRDIRDTVASAVRRGFPLIDRIGGAVEYAKYNCMLHMVWRNHSDFEFVYKDFIDNDVAEIKRLVTSLGFESVDLSKLAEFVRDIPTDQYQSTLLTPAHQTDKEQNTSFEITLGERLSREITSNHLQWLNEYRFKV